MASETHRPAPMEANGAADGTRRRKRPSTSGTERGAATVAITSMRMLKMPPRPNLAMPAAQPMTAAAQQAVTALPSMSLARPSIGFGSGRAATSSAISRRAVMGGMNQMNSPRMKRPAARSAARRAAPPSFAPRYLPEEDGSLAVKTAFPYHARKNAQVNHPGLTPFIVATTSRALNGA